eukprot:2670230-Pyramimonas_sp.AAC.1
MSICTGVSLPCGFRASSFYLVARAARAYPLPSNYFDVDAGTLVDPQGLHAHIAPLNNQLLDDEEEALLHASKLPEHEVARRRARACSATGNAGAA